MLYIHICLDCCFEGITESVENMELDIKQIMEIIPHRQPFLLVDRVTDMVPGKSIKG